MEQIASLCLVAFGFSLGIASYHIARIVEALRGPR